MARFSGLLGSVVASVVLLLAMAAPAEAGPIVSLSPQVSAHACAVTNSGGVVCWGNNFFGGLGDGTTTSRATPVAVSGLSSAVTAVVVGSGHTCALTTAGGVLCWGDNGDGRLGDGTTVLTRGTPGPVTGLASGVIALAAGLNHMCALSSGGGVSCWGTNTFGQLGDGTTTNRSTPVSVSGLSSGVTAITANFGQTCAVTSGGGVSCWGLNANGQLGDGTTTNRLTPTAVSGLSAGVTAVTAGFFHTCALTSGGAVSCWGDNTVSQLGDDTTTNRLTPVAVSGLASGVTAVSAGGNHNCVVTSAGGASCWGFNGTAQLGDGTLTTRRTPVAVSGLASGVVQVGAGFTSTCALTNAGVVSCWGDNARGQLGDGNFPVQLKPGPPSGLSSGVSAVSAGASHNCAATSAGGVSCWGSNTMGQLGDGTKDQRFTPTPVSGLSTGVTAVSAGGFFHTCALTSGGGVSCWGSNITGALGDGTTTERLTPVAVSGLSSGATAVTAGLSHTCALTSGGGVRCWGANSGGQLGDGTQNTRLTPVAVNGLSSGVIAVTTGIDHSCALTSAGAVLCWGLNAFGQLGDGTITSRTSPVAVSGLSSGVSAIAAGYFHTCAVNSGGGVVCWGDNSSGQLGDGTTTLRTTPVQVSGLTSGATALAGSFHTCAVVSGGAVSCWGGNGFGQLGDGTETTNRLTPVAVSGLTGAVRVTVGQNHSCARTTAGGVLCWGNNYFSEMGNGLGGYRPVPGAVVLPALSTNAASSVRTTSAAVGVSVTADGGVAITARGVCAGFAVNPTLSSSCTSSGTGTGTFTVLLTGLTPGRLYYARAFVTNAQGTFFGNEVTFTTPPPTMALERSTLAFSAISNGTSFVSQTGTQDVRLVESGAGTISWTAASNVPWLVVSPASGVGSTDLRISTQFVSGLTASQTGIITITLSGAANTVSPLGVTLTVVSTTAPASPPFGQFETPLGNTTVSGSVALTGWSLDNIGVQRLEIWRDLQSGETTTPFTSPSHLDPRTGKVFIGNATFVDGARPDIEGLHPSIPRNSQAGWGHMLLTWALPNQGNGTYRLHAYAFDQEGGIGVIGSLTMTVNNAAAARPFGSIDTPGIGGDASGPNFGWALTPNVNGVASCKIQPSGVQVSIDSGPLQPVVYGGARTDVAAAFPGLSNSAAAGGHYIFDWSTLSNGVHTIAWVATDDCNRADGIGSRFFNVSGNGPNLVAAVTAGANVVAEPQPESTAPITVARGYGELPEILKPGEAGSRTIEIKQGERIELRLPRGFESAAQIVTGGRRRALPIGATWDEAGGIFSWEPAPGFLGRYRLVFGNGSERISVRVIVTP